MSFALVMRRSGLSMGRRMAARRFESTTTTKAAEAAKQTASKASSTASEMSSKATQGLSRVTAAAGPAIANAAKGVSGALGRVGGRTGRLVAFVERKGYPSPSSSGWWLLSISPARGRWVSCLECMLLPCPVACGHHDAHRARDDGTRRCGMVVSWHQWLTFFFHHAGQTPFVVYYSKVGLEMAKLVIRGQNMSPP
jgi:hypothetical protein